MKFGFSKNQLEEIISFIKHYPEVEEAVLFGSRVIDTYKEASDVDIALKGEKVTAGLAAKLKFNIEEDTYLPFFFDFVAYPSITNEELIKHIKNKGIILFGNNLSEWTECKLEAIAEVQTGPFGSQLKNEQYITGGTPVITVEHIDHFRIADFNYPSVTDEDKNRLSKYLLKAGDIVFTRVGSVDLSAYVMRHQAGWMFSSRMLRVRPNQEVNSRFLSYFFQQRRFREYILNISVGATMPSINTEILKGIPVSYPPLSEQKAIVSVLSSLDDKIDLLHRQNKTLEAMAETLFRQWFVEEAEEDWVDGSLFNAIKLIGGGTPKTAMPNYWNGNIDWLSGGDISANHKGVIIKTEKSITQDGLVNSSAKLLPKYSTVISARGTVGKYCLLSKPMTFSQSNYGVRPKYSNTFFFTYLLIAHSVDELQSAAYGSVFDTITTDTFKGYSISLPEESVIMDFEEVVEPLFKKILNNSVQINTLENMRDTLLPKLMNGEVRVEK